MILNLFSGLRPDAQEPDTRNGYPENGEQKHVIPDGHVMDRQPKVLTYHIGMSAIMSSSITLLLNHKEGNDINRL